MLGTARAFTALDLRGHGDSQWSPDGSYSTTSLAADVADVVVRTGRPVDIVGSSWGGLIGLVLAAERPELVRSLVVLDAPPSFEQDESDVAPRPESWGTHAEVVAWERGRFQFASNEALEGLAQFGTRPGPAGRLYARHDPVLAARWPFRSDDHWPALPQIAAPVLLVRGGASGTLTTDVATRAARALPHGTFVEIRDAGHLVHVDAPAALARVLQTFWRAASSKKDEEARRGSA